MYSVTPTLPGCCRASTERLSGFRENKIQMQDFLIGDSEFIYSEKTSNDVQKQFQKRGFLCDSLPTTSAIFTRFKSRVAGLWHNKHMTET